MPDFYISHEADKGYPGWVNLIGIESPGLTSAIAIGEDVASWII
jgi:L-2-hydroxyglutarate oxidase LhgO